MSFLHSEPEPEQPRNASARPFVAVVGGGVLLIAGALTAYYWWGRESSPKRGEPAPAPKAPAVAPKTPSEPSPLRDREAAGSLEVTANVEGAAVFIDGERVGEAPYQEQLAPGSYEIRVERPGYRPFQRDVRIAAGRRARLEASLTREPAVLRVESDVPGASVFVDRRYLGTTPLETRDVSPGQHQITVSAEGFDMYADTFEMTDESRDLVVRFKEAKLDEAVAVVHKHRLGSCSGRLVATLAGLRYEASDKKDSFSAPFSRLAEFRVDYLEKNLKVRLTGGRAYNFTEPAGNADALYVFHQKVEAATKKDSH